MPPLPRPGIPVESWEKYGSKQDLKKKYVYVAHMLLFCMAVKGNNRGLQLPVVGFRGVTSGIQSQVNSFNFSRLV